MHNQEESAAALPRAAEVPATASPVAAGIDASPEGLPARRKLSLSLFRLLQITVTVGLISFLYYRIGWQPVAEAFSGVVWWWIAARFLAGRLSTLVVSFRWQILLKEQGISLPVILIFKRIWMGRFFNNFSVGHTGVDLFRVFSPWGMPLKKTAVGSSVVFDRYTGLMGLLVAIAVAGLVEHEVARDLGLELLPIFALAGAGLLLLAVVTHRPLEWSRRLIARSPVNKVRSIAEGILRSLLLYVDRRGTTLTAVALSVGFRLVTAISSYFGFLAFGIDISFGTVLFISLLVNVISLVPISINGWGIREGAFVLLYTQVGVGSAEALSVALLGRVLGILVSSVGGLMYLSHRPGK